MRYIVFSFNNSDSHAHSGLELNLKGSIWPLGYLLFKGLFLLLFLKDNTRFLIDLWQISINQFELLMKQMTAE